MSSGVSAAKTAKAKGSIFQELTYASPGFRPTPGMTSVIFIGFRV